MIIHKLEIENQSITISGEEIRLDTCGICFIRGENGTGKTTLIKSILENNKDITIDGRKLSDGKFRQIAYVPQEIPLTSQSVKEFVCVGQQVNREAYALLVTRFGLSAIPEATPVSKLSGGERSKLAIISALLKDVPFCIMDEPTNNLDDASTATFKEIVEEYAAEHTFLIATHDPRLYGMNQSELVIQGHRIIKVESSSPPRNTEEGFQEKTATGFSAPQESCPTQEDSQEELAGAIIASQESCPTQEDSQGEPAGANAVPQFYNEGKPNNSLTVNRLNMAAGFLGNKINGIVIVIAILIMTLLIVGNRFACLSFYALREEVNPNSILVYLIENTYGKMNEDYCRHEGISPSGSISNRISFQNIPEIAEKKGVSDIYIMYEKKYVKLYETVDSGKDAPMFEISVPEAASGQYAETMGLYDALILKTGHAPSDHKKEIALPEREIKKIAAKDDTDPKNLIGKKICYHGENYKLVGMTLFNLAWKSFIPGDDLLFYTYNKGSFEAFDRQMRQYRRREKFLNGNYVDNMIIITEHGAEKSILDELIQKYPADNYFSNEFDRVFVKVRNEPFMLRILLIDMMAAVGLAQLLYMVQKNRLAEDRSRIELYKNYYLNRLLVLHTYFAVHTIEDLILFLIFCASATVVLSDYPGIPRIIVFSAILMTLLLTFARSHQIKQISE